MENTWGEIRKAVIDMPLYMCRGRAYSGSEPTITKLSDVTDAVDAARTPVTECFHISEVIND